MGALETMAVLLMDAGLLALAVGLGSLVKPLRRLGIDSRRRAAAVAGTGAALALAAAALPAPVARSLLRPARIDDFLPAFQFRERHEIRVHAAPGRILWAIKTVPADEIALFRTLTWLRHPRLPWSRAEESILAPPPGKPILEVAAGSGFLLLAEEAEREVVFGTVVIRSRPDPCDSPRGFRELAEAGNAKAVINFLVEPRGGGWCRLSTETRIFATDPVTRLRFAAYWRVIAPGSALIRVEWLRAIRRRAESGGPANG